MRYFTFIIFIFVLLSLCCGGGDDGVVEQQISASFTPAKSDPDALDVSLQLQSRSGSTFTVDVVITDTNGVYSASFDLVYDGSLLDYLNYTEGTFLNKDGASTSFLISEQSGRVIVGATRLGQVGGVDATGDEILMSMAFRVRKTGSGSISFENSNLLDSNGTVIQGVEWFGGTASGS